MRKLLVALMMVAFAATAFAADVTFSGSYEFDGKYSKNYNLNESYPSSSVRGDDGKYYINSTQAASLDDTTGAHNGTLATDTGDSVNNSYYEHDLKLWMNVQTDKDTFLKVMTELVDNTVPAANDTQTSTYAPGTDSGYASNTQFSVQRAWLGHNFGAVTLEAGLMDSGAWGYSFGDNLEGSYRVKATFNDVAGGKLIVLTQKKAEYASNDWGNERKNANKDDADKYSVGYKGTFGNLFIAPKLDYDINSDKNLSGGYDGADFKTVDFDLAAGYTLGALALQGEYQLKHNTFADEDATHQNYDIYGWFLGASYKMGATTVGALSAYGSVSKDMHSKGYDFADDFDSTFILGDDLSVGSDQGGDLTGFWANAIYATYQATDKLSFMAKYAYATSNWHSDSGNNAYLKGASVWEADASATYAITKELSYYLNAGYAKVDLDNQTDPDAIILVKHGLVLSF